MSEINIIIVKGSDFYYTKMHYREIIKAINNPEEFKKLLKNKSGNSRLLRHRRRRSQFYDRY